MNLLEQHKDKLVLAAILVCILNVGALIFFKVVIPKIKDEIKNELKQPYGPSPFGPSVNPDVSLLQPKPTVNENIYGSSLLSYKVPVQNYDSWVGSWEKERLTP